MNNQTINEINKREIDKVFFSLTILSTDIFFNYGNDYIKKRTIYTIVGCNLNGVRKYITSVFADDYTKASDWYNLLLSFKNRGLEHIFYVCIFDDINIVKNAFNLAFKDITYFYHCFDIVNKLSHYVTTSYASNLLVKLKFLYLSNDINEFNLRKKDLFDVYQDTPFIIDILNKELNSFTPFLDYPLFLRKHIISFYFFREFRKSLSVAAHSNYAITSIEEFEEKLIPAIKTFELKMYCGKKEWNTIITYLYKSHKDLILCAL